MIPHAIFGNSFFFVQFKADFGRSASPTTGKSIVENPGFLGMHSGIVRGLKQPISSLKMYKIRNNDPNEIK